MAGTAKASSTLATQQAAKNKKTTQYPAMIRSSGINTTMNKEDIIRWYAGFCQSIQIDNGKIYLDDDHLLVYLEPKDGMITLGSEIHDARITYLVGKYDYATVDKLVAIWTEFMELNNDTPRIISRILPSV